jgi:hypothetical protein
MAAKRYKYDKEFPVLSDATNHAYVKRGNKTIMINIERIEPYVNNSNIVRIHFATFEFNNSYNQLRHYLVKKYDPPPKKQPGCSWCGIRIEDQTWNIRHGCHPACETVCNDCIEEHDSAPKKRKLRNPDHNPKNWMELK